MAGHYRDVLRGVRNGNPMNLKQPFNKAVVGPWVGSCDVDELGHAVFAAGLEAYLYRAMARLTWRKTRAGHNTLELFMRSYAPAGDGNLPEAYTEFLESRTKMVRDMRLRFFDIDVGRGGIGKLVEVDAFVDFIGAIGEMECCAGWSVKAEDVRSGVGVFNRDVGRNYWGGVGSLGSL